MICGLKCSLKYIYFMECPQGHPAHLAGVGRLSPLLFAAPWSLDRCGGVELPWAMPLLCSLSPNRTQGPPKPSLVAWELLPSSSPAGFPPPVDPVHGGWETHRNLPPPHLADMPGGKKWTDSLIKKKKLEKRIKYEHLLFLTHGSTGVP